MHKAIRIACVFAMLGIHPAYAAPDAMKHVPDALLVGKARMNVMMWDVYDASLFAPDGQFSWNQPFALKLVYLRDLAGMKIADRSIEEIRRQGFTDEATLVRWHAQLAEIIPDVQDGTSLTGIYTPGQETIFFNQEREIGRISDPDFGPKFFGIWLSDKTSAPDIRKKLLSGQPQTQGFLHDDRPQHFTHGDSYDS